MIWHIVNQRHREGNRDPMTFHKTLLVPLKSILDKSDLRKKIDTKIAHCFLEQTSALSNALSSVFFCSKNQT